MDDDQFAIYFTVAFLSFVFWLIEAYLAIIWLVYWFGIVIPSGRRNRQRRKKLLHDKTDEFNDTKKENVSDE